MLAALLVLNVLTAAGVVLLVAWVRDMRRKPAAAFDDALSLRDVIASLDRAAVLAEGVALKLSPAADVARAEFSRLVILLDRLESRISAAGIQTARIEASGVRAEAERAEVATALAISDAKVQGVADRLADSQQAARSVTSVHPGDQADAAAIGPVERPPTRRAPRGAKKKS